ncbi:MAG: hypothetical protein MjAS7_2011 [Metallosphaera javensis (ex Sakai et al. 2022)]|nr:MAG: hypothetical protein MjAS7_2011 [Metallosphaera javensis (ex Sakai et al. 2022)]
MIVSNPQRISTNNPQVFGRGLPDPGFKPSKDLYKPSRCLESRHAHRVSNPQRISTN